jgi:hypothetical protein
VPLSGKGYFIWAIPRTEGGSTTTIVNLAKAAGLTYVIIKIADGVEPIHQDTVTGADQIPPLLNALHSAGIQVWGWHYVYGRDPIGEAKLAVERSLKLGLDGYVINAEIEYKVRGMDVAARAYMGELKKGLKAMPVALSSFRFPSYHMQFPWRDFLDGCDYNMPQVYWLLADDAGAQLRRSVREFQTVAPYRPIIPTGSTFKYENWTPTPAQILDFMSSARALNIPSVNMYVWEACRNPASLRPLWDSFAQYPWPVTTPPSTPDIVTLFMAALNTHNPAAVAALYQPQAVHITSARTSQGTNALIAWYTTLFNQLLPNAVFTLTSTTGSGISRQITWNAAGPSGSVKNGSDTLGIADGKISYHYSQFTVSK